MKIRIWGARGSLPSPLRPEEVEEKIFQAIFGMPEIDTNDMEAVRDHVRELPPLLRGTAGGNTSCVEIQAEGETFIIDAGSGLRELGLELMKGPWGRGQGTLHFFFSHTHWDHIQGFPFFIPAYVPGNRIFVYSIHDLETVLDNQQRPRNFPVALSRMQAEIEFISLQVGQAFSVGKVHINTILNAHPGRAYSYRFEDQHSVFIFASDAEYKQLNDASVQPHVDFFRNADALIFDAQFTLKDVWWQKEDWGHSSAMIGVDLARAAEVKKLILFHHDPTYSDAQLQEIQSTAIAYQAQDPGHPTCEVIVAYEGLTLDLTPPDAVELQLTPDGEAAILTPTSVFDERGADQLAQQLAHLVEQDSLASSIIDLSQVETLTTASLKLLVALRRKDERAPIVLAGPSDRVLKVIKLGGYLDFFAIYPSVEAALSALHAREALNLPGQVIKGRYQIEKKVGESRLGTVLKATDLILDRPVVLKILSPSLSEETLDRFMRQTQQLISLDHRNIVKILDTGRDGGHSFIVEEFVARQTLQDLLTDNDRSLSADQALDIALDITLALEYAHSRGITHGNLKPHNVFLTDEGAKLSDVGLGRLEEGHDLLTAPLFHLTASYLAPEQILGQALDARTDLYALGVILYQLFTGRLPFQDTDWEVMQAHLHQAPPSPRELNPHISLSLEHLILKLLVKNPNARYASAEQAHRVSSSLIVNIGETKHQRRSPLIGRDEEMQILQGCWEKASSGQGQLVFITGESGIGKTRLAQQAAAQSEPPVLLIGRCQEPEGSPAYHPFAEALRIYFATVPPEFFDEEALQLLGDFSYLVPEIRQVLPDLPQPAPLEPKQEQLRLMSSLTQFIKRATGERPWLLILDDLQWADRSSLELLRYLGHHLPSMALLIIGTYCDVELGRGHPLLETVRSLSSHPAYRHLPLARLDLAGVEQILISVWQQPAPAALIEKIYQHTGGNPFYVEEVAKALVDDGLMILREGTWQFPELEEIRLPKSIREAVWRRIHYLSSDTQALLRQAAVLGPTFKFDDLRDMSGLSEWEVLEHLDMALERHLLQEVQGETLLCFSHAEIHYVLYEDMGTLRRRMLHRQAGEALAQRTLPDPERIAEQLAYHFSKAGEFEKALVYGIQAARQARDAYANEAALLWYNRTLEMLDQLDPDEAASFQPLRLPVHIYLGEVLTLVGRYDEALTHYDSARMLIEVDTLSVDQARQLAGLCCRMAEVYEKRSEYEVAFEWLERGLSYLNEDNLSNEAARIFLIGARTFDHQGRLDQAIDWCQTSLAIAAQIKTRETQQTVAQAYNRLSAISLLRGDFELVVHFCDESIQMYQQIGDIAGQVGPYNNLGTAYFNQGDWIRAIEAYAKSLEIAREIGDIEGQGRANSKLANVHLHRGEWDQAMSQFKQNQLIWQQIGMARGEAKTLSKLAQMYMYRENWPEARACLSRSQTIFTELGSDDYLPELERRWGQFYLKTGELDQALAHAHRSIELAVEQVNPLEEGKSHRVLGQVHLARKEQELARVALHHSLQVLKDFNSQYEVAKTRMSLVRLALETGLMDRARTHLVQAIQTFERLGARPNLAAAQALEKELPPEQ